MTQTTQNKGSVDLALNAVIQAVKQEDLNVTKCSLKELISQKNAYTQTNAQLGEEAQRWNMITYKKGKKSSL